MLHDLRDAIRNLVRSPSYSVAAVLTLALGIAANTIVFTLLNSLLLRPIPVPHALRVVRLHPVDETGRAGNLFSYPDSVDYRTQAPGFEAIAAYIPAELTTGRSSLDRGVVEARTVVAYVVSASYFDLVGLQPSLGRLFVAADERESRSPAVVVSYTMWQRRFGGDPAVLGARLILNGQPFTIVGVGPPEFRGTEPLVADAWMPLSALPLVSPERAGLERRDAAQLLMIGRLKPGVSRASAASALSVIARRLAAAYPADRRPRALAIAPGTFFTFDPGLRPVIAVVMATVGLVLLIAGANVMNLTLARATARQKEIAVRIAIGAGRWRIVRHLVTETMLVAMLAGGVGLLLSMWVLRVLYRVGLELSPFPWTITLSLAPDVRVFGYTFGLAAVAGLVFGVVPAVQLSSRAVTPALHDEGRMLGLPVTRSRVRRALVVLQLAAAVVLLVAAGLLTRGLRSARAFDLGFTPDGVVYSEYNLRRSAYTAERAAAFSDELRARARQIPGVTAVALTSAVPPHGGITRTSVSLAGDNGSRKEPLSSLYSVVSPEYFEALDVRIVQGRCFDPDDPADAGAVVISEGLGRRFWPQASAIGKTITIAAAPGPLTVVGVARDASDVTIWREKEMSLYLPLRQSSDMRDMHLVLRTAGDTRSAAIALRRHAAAIDRDVAFDADPLDKLLQFWILPSRVAAAGAGVLGLVALAIASIGIYGVLAFAVSHRTREIGIRMALGADARGVRRLVLVDGFHLIAAGVATGIAVALAASPLLQGLLFDVTAFDPLTFTAVPLLLAVVALAACYVPARRASKLEPLAAVRVE